jgi:hypothetical protein
MASGNAHRWEIQERVAFSEVQGSQVPVVLTRS